MYFFYILELANRKILEELQLKKQMLLKQGVVTPLTATSIPLTQPSPVSQLPMCSIPPVSATAVSIYTHCFFLCFFVILVIENYMNL